MKCFTQRGKHLADISVGWAIREAHHVGIGDFYKPTIFLAGVYESSDMRIVSMQFIVD